VRSGYNHPEISVEQAACGHRPRQFKESELLPSRSVANEGAKKWPCATNQPHELFSPLGAAFPAHPGTIAMTCRTPTINFCIYGARCPIPERPTATRCPFENQYRGCNFECAPLSAQDHETAGRQTNRHFKETLQAPADDHLPYGYLQEIRKTVMN
jgi:hypothetical protein